MADASTSPAAAIESQLIINNFRGFGIVFDVI
jgi:hypothetical protein